MSRRHAPTLDLVRPGNFGSRLAQQPTRPSPFGFAAPPCFISALALGLIVGAGSAAADPGACNATGSNLTCTGTVTNPSAFTPTSDFTVDIGTTTPSVSPAYITQGSGFAGIKINAGDFGGSISMTTGSTISVAAGGGTSRNGMVVASYGEGATRTYTLNIDGTITSDASDGDALRLEGSSSTIFNATFGRDAQLGGGAGDDGVTVTGAESLLLNNYGIIEGGSAHPDSGGEGINVGDGTRIAAEGVAINNYKTITGTGDAGIAGGQGITVFSEGDVTITNSRNGDVTGTSQGVRVEADGVVSITNDGHIQGNSEAGVEIADATTANVTNRSRNTISGATDGLYVHDVDAANIDNSGGHTVGNDGDGVRVDNIGGNVTVVNRLGLLPNASTIEGSNNGLAMTDVDGNISVDNNLGGKIIGHGDDGIVAHDTNGSVGIDNSLAGTVSGNDDGIHVSDTRDDVTINNSGAGSITGTGDDGIDVSSARGDVTISNDLAGHISGNDNGVQIRNIRGDVGISNDLASTINGSNGAGIDIDRVRGGVSVSNIAGQITGGRQGIDVSNVGDDLQVDNTGGRISGQSSDGIRAQDIGGGVEITNAVLGVISGNDDGIHVRDVDDAVAINNSLGTITGSHDDGIDISDVRDDVNIDNSRGGAVTGYDNGVQISDVSRGVTIDNSQDGQITGQHGNAVDVDDVRRSVTLDNTAGGTVTGDDAGARIADVRGNVTISNAEGTITGQHDSGIDVSDVRGRVDVGNDNGSISGGEDGAHIEDVRGDVTLHNWGGEIVGQDDGVHIRDAHDDVTISNSFGGAITGTGDDGIDIRDVADDVRISNSFGGSITGHDVGITMTDVGDDVVVDNRFGGQIVGQHDDGMDIDDVDGSVSIRNGLLGSISGHDDGVHISDVDEGVTIDNSFGGAISGSRDDGMDISDVRDDVSIDNRFGGRVTGHDNGIQIRDARGDVTIANAYGGEITGRDGNGVDVGDVRGDVTLDDRNGGNVAGDDAGARIANVRGDVAIFNANGTISGRHDSGVDVSDVHGDVSVGNDNGSITGGDDGARIEDVRGNVALHNWSGELAGQDDGVHIRDVREGVTISNSFGGTITGMGDDGIDVADVRDDVRIDNRFGGSIAGRDDGVTIEDAGDDVRIDNSFGGSISGSRGDGVAVHDVDDDVAIDNRFGGQISGRDDGVKVRDAGGDVSIANSFGGEIRAYVGDGVDVDGAGGTVRINNQIGGSIAGRDDGVNVDRAEGNVNVDNNYGVIRGRNGAGIDIGADGAVTVDNAGGVVRGRTNAIAIDADTAEINSSGLIQSGSIFRPTILLSTEEGATLNNDEGGLIRGFRGSPADLAVRAHDGAVTINNAGTIIGRVDLSDAGDTVTPNTFNNSSDDSWHVLGTSQLGNGLADTFNNTGTIYTTDPDHPSNGDVTELAGVEYFNNGSLGATGTIDMQDGYTGDVFTLSPTDGGTLQFNGADGQSILKVDSFLGTASNSSSDTLVIDGSVTGSTAIFVNNVNSGFGGFNPKGIDVVDATGELPPDSFHLANGPINTGMFTYDLYLNAQSDWVLASAPNHVFFELPTLTSAAQSIWHDAAGGWLDRTADLRAALETPCDAGSLKDPKSGCTRPTSGAWAKVLGSSESRSVDHGFSVVDTVQHNKVDTQLDGGGVIGGYDVIRSMDDGPGIWMAGIMGGYLRSSLNFDNSVTDAKFESGAVGGYLTYLRGGWFLDGQVLANLGTVRYSGTFSQKDHANVTSIGGVLDTGYRMAYGMGFIEPGATLSYVNSDIDDLGIYGTTVNFTSGDSLRGRVGLRLGTTVVKEQAKYEPFIGVSALYEFLGDNTADVTSGDYVVKATDNLTGALGEVTGGVNVFSLAGDGFSAFAKGGFEFGKDDLIEYGGTLGVRVDW